MATKRHKKARKAGTSKSPGGAAARSPGLLNATVLFVLLWTFSWLSPTYAQKLLPAVWPAPPKLTAAKLEHYKLRAIEGKHLTLVTDLPSTPEIDSLVEIAGNAVPQLANYFGVTRSDTRDWHVQAYLIGQRAHFDAAQLMPPEEHRDFPHALSMGYEVWLNEQPTTAYQRCLLIHELTHSFMSTQLGGCGPGWYMEATAELMGAHQLHSDTGALSLCVMPATRRALPHWGRVPLIRDARQPLSVEGVMKIDNRRVMSTTSYAWVWALAKFLDTHPEYQDRWRELPENVLRRDFNDRFRRTYRRDWSELNKEWVLFCRTLVYGHNIEREAIRFKRGNPITRTPELISLETDRGWQPSSISVDQGDTLKFAPRGRFTIAREPDERQLESEAGGITLYYHAGRPIGQLIGIVDRGDSFGEPFTIGLGGNISMPASGDLYLRVNDAPNALTENKGTLSITVRAVQ